MPARLRTAAVSDVGSSRTVSQDAAFTASWGAAVADGVGGGPSGDLVALSLEAGTRDNVTAVVCDVDAVAEQPMSDRAAFYGAAAQRFCEEVDTA